MARSDRTVTAGTAPTASAIPPASLFRNAPPRRGAGVGAFLLAIVTAGALAHVAVRLKGLEVAYDLGRERRIATEMEEQRRRLQIEIGMLKDPGRIISVARDKLNMGPPVPEAIRRLGSGPLADRLDRAAPVLTAGLSGKPAGVGKPAARGRGHR
jgi:cell division protein FtsL